MRNIKILSFLVFYFLLNQSLSAAPTCGTIMPSRKEIQWGLTFNSIEKYRMKGAVNEVDIRSNQLFFTLTYGLFDWFSLDGKIGTGDVRNDKANNIDIDYDPTWGGGYGFRLKAYENKISRVKLILGLHHISIHPHAETINAIRYKSIIDDNQIDATVSKEFAFGVPYIGTKLSKSRILRRDDSNSSSLHSDLRLGVILGYDLQTSKNAYLNIEVRFIDENSLTFGITHTF